MRKEIDPRGALQETHHAKQIWGSGQRKITAQWNMKISIIPKFIETTYHVLKLSYIGCLKQMVQTKVKYYTGLW